MPSKHFPNGSHLHLSPVQLTLPARGYARDFSEKLGLPIHVYLSDKTPARSVSDEERTRIRGLLPGASVYAHAPKGPSGGVVINLGQHARPDQHQLDTKFESLVDRHDKRRILVALGQHASGLRALDMAVRIAQATGSEILLYHTSWHKDRVSSSDPWCHMSRPSRVVFALAYTRCHSAGVSVKTVIETSQSSPDLARAVVKAAYVYECHLIVLARGERALSGSNADRVRARSLVPVLVVADTYAKKASVVDTSGFSADDGQCPFELPASRIAAPQAASGWSSYGIMAVSFVKYTLQLLAFFWAWRRTRVEMFLAQVFHMGSDVIQSLLNTWVTHDSRKPATREFPFGRRNGPVIANFFTGLTLFAIVLKLVYDSGRGLVHPNAHPQHYPAALFIITGISALASLIIGRFQIVIGKKNGDPAIEADGHETISDALIDVAAFAGTLGLAIFQAAWIEHLLGLVVAAFVSKTAFGLVRDGWKTLNQRTIGLNHEDAVIEICQRIPGVAAARVTESFGVGTMAVCNLRLTAYATNGDMHLIQEVLEQQIHDYLISVDEFKTVRLNFQAELPPSRNGRVALAVREDRSGLVVASFEDATDFLICDLDELGDDRITREPVSPDLSVRFALLAEKHIQIVHVWSVTKATNQELARHNLIHAQAPCRNPAYLARSLF